MPLQTSPRQTFLCHPFSLSQAPSLQRFPLGGHAYHSQPYQELQSPASFYSGEQSLSVICSMQCLNAPFRKYKEGHQENRISSCLYSFHWLFRIFCCLSRTLIFQSPALTGHMVPWGKRKK